MPFSRATLPFTPFTPFPSPLTHEFPEPPSLLPEEESSAAHVFTCDSGGDEEALAVEARAAAGGGEEEEEAGGEEEAIEEDFLSPDLVEKNGDLCESHEYSRNFHMEDSCEGLKNDIAQLLHNADEDLLQIAAESAQSFEGLIPGAGEAMLSPAHEGSRADASAPTGGDGSPLRQPDFDGSGDAEPRPGQQSLNVSDSYGRGELLGPMAVPTHQLEGGGGGGNPAGTPATASHHPAAQVNPMSHLMIAPPAKQRGQFARKSELHPA